MRKKLKKIWNYVKVTIIMTVFAMTLTACSDKKEGNDQVENKQQSEYVYQPSFQSFSNEFNSISNICMKDKELYMFGSKWEMDEKKQENSSQSIYFAHCGMDGSDLKKTKLKGLKENEYIMVQGLDTAGKFHLITEGYDFNEKTGEGKEAYYVHKFNEKGKLIDTIELKREKSKSAERFFYPNTGNTIFAEDKIYIAGEQNIYCFNKNGKEEKVYEIKDMNYVQCLVMSTEGKAYIYGNVGEDYGFREFDLETGKTGTVMPLGEYEIYNLRAVNALNDNKLAINDGNNLYIIDLSSGEVNEELNWINSDVNGENVKDCFSLEDGNFFVIGSSYDNNKGGDVTEFITMKKVNSLDVKEKKILTFACADLDHSLKDQILSFNKTNKEYRINIKSYGAYEDSAEKLKMDISSGMMPDILDVGIGISKDQMIKKGMFTDLYPFMEKDKEIKKEDFFPSILKILETDGKLYYMASSFSLQGLVAGKKMYGSEDVWNIDDMIKKYQEMPEGSVFMENMTRQWFMQNVIFYQMKDYIDYSNNKVNFNSDDFIKLIEFSSYFPDEKDTIEKSREDMPTLVNKGKLLFNDFNISSVEDIGMYASLYKKQKGYTVLGYPLKEKSNELSVYFYNSALAISEQCKEKEGAWSFIRELLTYEYQKNSDSYYGIPTRKDALEKKLEYAQATKAYTDEDGTRVEPLQVSYEYDDYSVKIGPISKKDAEIVTSLIDRAGFSVSYDIVVKDIFEIVNEEVKAYYAGDKSAKEAAEIIQNRVGIYISENS